MLFRRHLELLHKDSNGNSLNINRDGLTLLKKYYDDGARGKKERKSQPARYQKRFVADDQVDNVVSKLSTIELWFNDQNVASKTIVVADGINQPKNDPGSPFRFAHSKVGGISF